MTWWILGGALIAGLVTAHLSVGASIRVAHRLDFLDYPDSARKAQTQPIPKLGGVAVAYAFLVVTTAALLVIQSPRELQLALSAVVPALLAGFVGYVDDRRHLNPYLRLVLQGIVGVLVWWLGSRVALFDQGWLDAALVIVFVIALINGLNLLDNSDGLAASTVVVSALGASLVAVTSGQELVSLLGFSLVGVSLGFLSNNWFPARVYLGDSGAYFLATLLAVLIIRMRPDAVDQLVGATIGLLLVVLPLADTSYVVVKRIRAGIHPFTAGRDHLSHALQARGRSVPTSVLFLQLISVTGAIGAVALATI